MLLENKTYPILAGESLQQQHSKPRKNSSSKYSAIYCDTSIANAILSLQKTNPHALEIKSNPNEEGLIFTFPSKSNVKPPSVHCDPVPNAEQDYILVYDPKTESFVIDSLSSVFMLSHDQSTYFTNAINQSTPEKKKVLPGQKPLTDARAREEKRNKMEGKKPTEKKEVEVENEEEGTELDDMEILNSLNDTAIAPLPPPPPPSLSESDSNSSRPINSVASTSVPSSMKRRPISLSEKLGTHTSDESSSSEEEEGA